MDDPSILLTAAAMAIIAVAITSLAALKGWQGWLELKRLEIGSGRSSDSRPIVATRIDVAELKDRIRKLEAIASGIDY
jgi:hypothetical protein